MPAVTVVEPVTAEVRVTVQVPAVVVQVAAPRVPTPVLLRLIVVPSGTLTRPEPWRLSTLAGVVMVGGGLTLLEGFSGQLLIALALSPETPSPVVRVSGILLPAGPA